MPRSSRPRPQRATGNREPEKHQSKKGNEWYLGMKAHIGVDAGTGYVHTVTTTAANVHDLDQIGELVPWEDEVAYGDAGYQGAHKRPGIAGDEARSRIEFLISARKSLLAKMAAHDRGVQARKAGVRAKVEHPFLIVKRD